MKPEEIILGFVTTEKAIRNVQEFNTIVVYVQPKANKSEIKKAIEKLFNTKVKKVNTLNTPDNKKKAYVKLAESGEALRIYQELELL